MGARGRERVCSGWLRVKQRECRRRERKKNSKRERERERVRNKSEREREREREREKNSFEKFIFKNSKKTLRWSFSLKLGSAWVLSR